MSEKKRKILGISGVIVGFILLLIIVIYDAMKPSYDLTEKADIAMGTVVVQKLYSEKDCSETVEEIEKVIEETENNISWRIEGSQVSYLNSCFSVEADEKFLEIMERCCDVYRKSDGAFDITVGSLSTLWNIGEENASVPSENEIKDKLKLVDGNKIKISNGNIKIGKNQMIDLGAIGKGLACDYIKEVLEDSSVYGAIISVGGSILLYGNNPGGDSWKVAVRNPRGESGDTLGCFNLKSGFVSTSGDYERVLTVDGKKYHHILDSKTGYPAENELMSVTVVCDNGLLSDALSTAAFVLGKEKGMALLEKYDADGIFVEKDFSVTLTEGLKDSFKLTDNSFVLREDG